MDLRLVAKVESQLKSTQKACAKVTTAETAAKTFDSISIIFHSEGLPKQSNHVPRPFVDSLAVAAKDFAQDGDQG